jgi:NAD(P)-dependent dehydrogenase (short-subunit alcohol dehydrogenase family)
LIVKLKQLFDLTGRVALVTGGSRGLGLDMAEALGELGARVALVARRAAELEEAKDELATRDVDAFTVTGDISRRESIEGVVDAIARELGEIDILVNNAGTSWGANAEDYPLEGWNKVVDLNLTGTWLLTQRIARRCMIPRRTGRIINIASTAGLQGSKDEGFRAVAYHASKGGLISLTRALAAEWGAYGIRVNAICPGFIPTRMTREVLDHIGRQVVDGTPLGRLGSGDDLKGIVALLASDASRHITGQAIVIDGGFTIV